MAIADDRPEPDWILTRDAMTDLVEERVLVKGLSYIDAVLDICDERGIDPSDAGKLIDRSIRDKLEVEGMKKSLLPKRNDLGDFIL